MRTIKLFLIIIFISCSISAFAEDIAFVITVDKNKISLGEYAQLNLTFHGTQDVRMPGMPKIKGFKVSFKDALYNTSIVNGHSATSVTYKYSLFPVSIGKMSIGPFQVNIKGQDYVSNTAEIEVFKGQPPARNLNKTPKANTAPSSVYDDIDKNERVFVKLEPLKSTIYVNEVIPLSVKLNVNNIPLREIQYPVFEHKGFSVEEFKKPEQYPKIFKGLNYEVVEFKTFMFGTRPGTFDIGPATITGKILVQKSRRRRASIFDDDIFANFFGGYNTYPIEKSSNKVPITVLPLPEEGKPESFKGAVGDFDLDMTINSKKVQAGDPLTLKMIITGNGNFNSVNVPELVDTKDFKVYEPQVVEQTKNKKVFEIVIIPKRTDTNKVSEAVFSYFIPETKAYREIRRGPINIEVTKPENGDSFKVIELSNKSNIPTERETFGSDILYIKKSLGDLTPKESLIYKDKIYVFIQLLPLLLIVPVYIIRVKQERMSRDSVYARKTMASKQVKKDMKTLKTYCNQKDTQLFYDKAFKMMQEYISGKFHLPVGGITEDIVNKELSSVNVDKEILDRIKSVFRDCDMSRYALSGFTDRELKASMKNIEIIIDHLEKVRK